MMKIPCLFEKRNGFVIPKLAEGCEWVMSGDNGLMTIKIDGVNVKVSFDEKDGWVISKRMSETSYLKSTRESDPLLWKAFDAQEIKNTGIFEVYGEGIKGNPHKINGTFMIKIVPVDYTLIVKRYETIVLRGAMHTVGSLYENIRTELEHSPEIEGFVFHLEKGDMELSKAAKITKKDYGLPWPEPEFKQVELLPPGDVDPLSLIGN